MKYAAWAIALWGLALALPAQTLPQRDPTLPPASMVGTAAGDDAAPSAGALLLNGSGANVVVRDGKPFLVVGSRLVAPGQTVESYRLERITETEIWLRDASGLTKVARFAGVQRQPSAAQCAVPPAKKVASAKKPPKKLTPGPRPSAHPPSPHNNAHDC